MGGAVVGSMAVPLFILQRRRAGLAACHAKHEGGHVGEDVCPIGQEYDRTACFEFSGACYELRVKPCLACCFVRRCVLSDT